MYEPWRSLSPRATASSHMGTTHPKISDRSALSDEKPPVRSCGRAASQVPYYNRMMRKGRRAKTAGGRTQPPGANAAATMIVVIMSKLLCFGEERTRYSSVMTTR